MMEHRRHARSCFDLDWLGIGALMTGGERTCRRSRVDKSHERRDRDRGVTVTDRGSGVFILTYVLLT